MIKEAAFFIYCVEQYKAHKPMTGKEVMDLFERYGVVNYLWDCYEALHTTGSNYLMEDIDAFLQERYPT